MCEYLSIFRARFALWGNGTLPLTLLASSQVANSSSLPFSSCRDPDTVAFCVLAADEEDEGDIALQIHFTLIQAFCCENDIDIVRVNDIQKLAAIVGAGEEAGEPRDLHCILITVSVHFQHWDRIKAVDADLAGSFHLFRERCILPRIF